MIRIKNALKKIFEKDLARNAFDKDLAKIESSGPLPIDIKKIIIDRAGKMQISRKMFTFPTNFPLCLICTSLCEKS